MLTSCETRVRVGGRHGQLTFEVAVHDGCALEVGGRRLNSSCSCGSGRPSKPEGGSRHGDFFGVKWILMCRFKQPDEMVDGQYELA